MHSVRRVLDGFAAGTIQGLEGWRRHPCVLGESSAAKHIGRAGLQRIAIHFLEAPLHLSIQLNNEVNISDGLRAYRI